MLHRVNKGYLIVHCTWKRKSNKVHGFYYMICCHYRIHIYIRCSAQIVMQEAMHLIQTRLTSVGEVARMKGNKLPFLPIPSTLLISLHTWRENAITVSWLRQFVISLPLIKNSCCLSWFDLRSIGLVFKFMVSNRLTISW